MPCISMIRYERFFITKLTLNTARVAMSCNFHALHFQSAVLAVLDGDGSVFRQATSLHFTVVVADVSRNDHSTVAEFTQRQTDNYN